MPPINKNNNRYKNYWLAQSIGWFSFNALIAILSITLNEDIKSDKKFIFAILFNSLSLAIAGIISTHIFRVLLNKLKLFNFNIGRIITLFISGSILIAVIFYNIDNAISKQLGAKLNLSIRKLFQDRDKKLFQDKIVEYKWPASYYKDSLYLKAGKPQFDSLEKIKRNFRTYQNVKGEYKAFNPNVNSTIIGQFFQIFLFIIPWLLLYFIWKYVERNRNDQIDKLKLQTTVKELELKTIKGHINPHFIFNSLNSIRALVDENPTRARTAITELSNILRSSLQVEKIDVVPLEKELAIVKDYLALEKIRFENRLTVVYNIDNATLKFNVPPMMVQILVENALKHGIGKLIDGGIVKIESHIAFHQHIIIITNDGVINNALNSVVDNIVNNDGGFGLASTNDRLNILYGGKASFTIKNENKKVIATITIPI